MHHCLLGYAQPSASSSETEKASLAHVKRVYSHPQAWGQVTRFMRERLRGIETIDVSSTSRAAALAKADATGSSAAVSSALAAEVQGLEVLARNIEDRDDNTTRFFVLRKTEDTTAATEAPQQTEARAGGEDGKKYKSLVSFTVPHSAPGALADVLDCFRAGGLNLTSINSRPSLREPFQYVFFVEFEGHRYDDPEGRVQDVLEGIARVAQSWRWLGSWVNMRV